MKQLPNPMKGVREFRCDHLMEHTEWKGAEVFTLCNTIFTLCNTCYDAMRGMVLGEKIMSWIKQMETPRISNVGRVSFETDGADTCEHSFRECSHKEHKDMLFCIKCGRQKQ